MVLKCQTFSSANCLLQVFFFFFTTEDYIFFPSLPPPPPPPPPPPFYFIFYIVSTTELDDRWPVTTGDGRAAAGLQRLGGNAGRLCGDSLTESTGGNVGLPPSRRLSDLPPV